jgi:thioredoxin-like negative regulator of GroEL
MSTNSCRPNVLQMTAGQAKRFLEAQDKPTLVQFAADWCEFCQASKPEVEATSAALCDRARVVRVNVDKAPQLADKFGVNALPDFVVMHKGRVVARIKGYADRKTLLKAVAKALKTHRK